MSQVNTFPTATNSASTITAQNPFRIPPSPFGRSRSTPVYCTYRYSK
jgi:hypothetical protein